MKSVQSCLGILTWQVYIQNKAGKITFKSLEIGFVKIVCLNVITLFTFLLVTTIEGKRVEREIYNFELGIVEVYSCNLKLLHFKLKTPH